MSLRLNLRRTLTASFDNEPVDIHSSVSNHALSPGPIVNEDVSTVLKPSPSVFRPSRTMNLQVPEMRPSSMKRKSALSPISESGENAKVGRASTGKKIEFKSPLESPDHKGMQEKTRKLQGMGRPSLLSLMSSEEPLDVTEHQTKLGFYHYLQKQALAEPQKVKSQPNSVRGSKIHSSSAFADEWFTSTEYANAENAIVLEVDGLRRSNQSNEDIFDYCVVVNELYAVNTTFIVDESGRRRESITVDLRDFPAEDSAKNMIVQRILNARLEVVEEQTHVPHQKLLKIMGLSDRLELEAEILKLPAKLRTGGWAPFSLQNRSMFLGTPDPTAMFHSSERQMLLQRILHAPVEQLGAALDDGILSQAIVTEFPVHMQLRKESLAIKWIEFWRRGVHSGDDEDDPFSAQPIDSTSKAIQLKTEANLFNCDCFSEISYFYQTFIAGAFYQPLDSIADYYGTEIAFYFAWLGFYSRWLIAPAIVGLVLFIVQTFSFVDGPLVPFFCLFIACWSTLFIEMWQREEKILANRWGVSNYETHEEQQRIGFVGSREIDPVTQKTIVVFPDWMRWLRLCISVPFLLLFASMCMYVMILLFSNWGSSVVDHSKDQTGTSFVSAPFLYGFMIPILDLIYFYFAKKFVIWENYQTDSAFYRSLTIKVFLFRFMNCFASLFYYAFYQIDLSSLGNQLLSFMIAGQVFLLLYKTVWPVMIRKFKIWRSSYFLEQHLKAREALVEARVASASPLSSANSSGNNSPHAIRPPSGGVIEAVRAMVIEGGTYSLQLLGVDYSAIAAKRTVDKNGNLEVSEACIQSIMPVFSSFEEYAEMIIQFGYVTFFSVAFPFAPFLALLNNVIAIRGSAFNLSYGCQRPIARKASSIGIWLEVLQFMSLGSLLTNCAIIFFTSTQLQLYFPQITESQKIWAIFIFEHIMLFARYLIHINVPSLPAELQDKILREKFEADKQLKIQNAPKSARRRFSSHIPSRSM